MVYMSQEDMAGYSITVEIHGKPVWLLIDRVSVNRSSVFVTVP